jgi:hypothetical protein
MVDPLASVAVRSLSSSPVKNRSSTNKHSKLPSANIDSKFFADFSTALEHNIESFIEARLEHWELVSKQLFLYLTGIQILDYYHRFFACLL